MRTALITGANRGIGLGLAKVMSARGIQVIGTSRNVNDARELGAVARVVQLDVTDGNSVSALADRLRNEDILLDVLVNNAGWAREIYPHSMAEVLIDVEHKAFDINVVGALRVLQRLVDVLAPDAKVVNMSTRLASLTNTAALLDPVYTASKTALNMLTRQLAFDEAFAGRCLVAVSPGWVRTRMGGPKAALSVEESTTGLMHVIEGLTPEDSGKFLNYDGTPIPW